MKKTFVKIIVTIVAVVFVFLFVAANCPHEVSVTYTDVFEDGTVISDEFTYTY